MSDLQWSNTLELGFSPIDQLHQPFVLLLAKADDCPDAELPVLWTELVELAHHLFNREDEWMVSTQFSSAASHSLQHRVVLNVMREGVALARAGQLTELRTMLRELSHWFPKHIQSLDAALALHLRRHPEAFPTLNLH